MRIVDLNIPNSLWTARDSLRLAQDTLASIKLRTSRGIDANGKPFDEYSTKPIYVSKKGARLAPKGGRKTRVGKRNRRGRGSKIGTSIYYAGGYRQYKEESRRRGEGSSAEVDLVLSGQLMNNLVVKKATVNGFTIGLTKHVQSYGYHVNDKREYLGLTNKEIDILLSTVYFEVAKRLKV